MENINIEWMHIRTAYYDLSKIRELFSEYSMIQGAGVCFKSFEKEMAQLPGEYALPHGRLYLVNYKTEVVGCIALKQVLPNDCEVKRLYVKPEFRGKGIGKALLDKVIEQAKQQKYDNIFLETLENMKEAISIYCKNGFNVEEKNGAILKMKKVLEY